MSQPESKQNEPGKINKPVNGGSSGTIMSRLPHNAGGGATKKPETPASPLKTDAPRKSFFSVSPKAEKPKTETKPKSAGTTKTNYSGYGFLPTFWTIASVISMLINIVVVIALIVVVQLLGGTKSALDFAQSQVDGLLGGLYNNFVKMDAASIKTTIHVEKDIPVQFTLNVSGATNVTLNQDVRINGAVVTLTNAGSLIKNENANIILPAGTVLPIFIENLVVPVDKTVLAVLDVPVNIPLNQTELHEPFVGLQKVVEPYYCLLQPNIVVNGVNVCANAAPILPIAP